MYEFEFSNKFLNEMSLNTSISMYSKIMRSFSVEFTSVLSNAEGNEDDYSAMEVILSLQAHGWMISNNEQHDAYEFYQLLIATLNEEIDKLFVNSKDDVLKIR